MVFIQIRNEGAEEFLKLLKEWEKLCKQFAVKSVEGLHGLRKNNCRVTRSRGSPADVADTPKDEHEVSSLVDICYGDPNEIGKPGLHFKVPIYFHHHCSLLLFYNAGSSLFSYVYTY